MAGFNEILGQNHIVSHFKNAIRLNKLSHAYIINGEIFSGKKTLATAVAMAVQCGNPEPCMKCRSCKQCLSGNHPDIKWITYEKGSIGVDEIREQINNDIVIRPYSSEYKIYIIPDAENMTLQAQNALLKTIEEPPAYAIILLLASNSDLFLQTIISRCILLNIKPVPEGTIKNLLMRKYMVTDYEAAVAASFADGNIGKAIRLASSEDFNRLKSAVVDSLKKIDKFDMTDVIDRVKLASEFKNDIDEYFNLVRIWFRDVAMLKSTGDPDRVTYKDEYKNIKKQAQKFSYMGIEKAVEAVDKAEARIKTNVNFDNAIELMFLSIIERIQR